MGARLSGEDVRQADAYRPDIDGLRAIAVLPVVLFHGGVSGFDGGFVGVDVFFVISGFLIGQILLRDIEARQFSLIAFYERRVRRIIPALMVMMAVTLAVGALFMMPRDYKELGESAVAATTFLSNVYFYLRADYFDTSAAYKPLLHTWSLAVEEQYYLFFPILLWALMRTIGRNAFWAIIGFAALSFAFGIYQTNSNPTGAFYLPMSRMWELLLGALIAMRPPQWGRSLSNLAAWAGVAMIFAAVFLFTEETPFPGYTALLPCVGTALVIAAKSDGIVARVLSSPLPRGIGLISYSLYLWHWPIMSLMGYYYQRETPPLVWGASFVVLFAVSYLSWRYIEGPVRRDRALFTRWRLFGAAAAVSAAVIGFGVWDFATRGLPGRFAEPVTRIALSTYDTNPRNHCDSRSAEQVAAGDVCAIGVEDGPPTFALIGDSMGDALAPGVDAAAREAGRGGVVLTRAGCYSLLFSDAGGGPCAHFMRAAVDYIQRTPSIDTVIVVNRWSSAAEASRFGEDVQVGWNFYLTDDESNERSPAENQRVLTRALDRTLNALAPRRVVMVAYIPEQAFDVPRRLALETLLQRPLTDGVSLASFEQRQASARRVLTQAAAGRAEIIDLGAELCGDGHCRMLDADGAALYADDNHLSRAGAVGMAPYLARAFESQIAAPAPAPAG